MLNSFFPMKISIRKSNFYLGVNTENKRQFNDLYEEGIYLLNWWQYIL